MKLEGWKSDPRANWLDDVATAVVGGALSSLGFAEVDSFVTKRGVDDEAREAVYVVTDPALLEFQFSWNPGRPTQQPFRQSRLSIHRWVDVGVRLEATEDHEHEGAMENREWAIVVGDAQEVILKASARTQGIERLAAFGGACISRATGALPPPTADKAGPR